MRLYPHQLMAFDALMNGQNVILQAPTGSGKTDAALYPFFFNMARRYSKLPPKCLYATPMRILVKQFLTKYHATVEKFNRDYGLTLDVKAQTGEQSNDPKLQAHLIFATIDQTLSSYLLAPYGLSKRQANLNAAAVLGSYLVFDEFHLFDPQSTLPTTLHMLRALHGIAPFILMTATFSDEMLHELSVWLNAVVISRHEVDFSAISSQQKTRRFHAITAPLTADEILASHQTRSVVICNRVERAMTLYRELTQQATVEVLLLHSRFLPEDRAATEERIKKYFGKERELSGSYIVVATQAIEVGVDITSEVLHTELAPANAIIQRAGRCARYKGDRGDVRVYRHVISDGEQVDLCDPNEAAPYISQKELFQLTWESIAARDGAVFDFDTEQTIISDVHNASDSNMLRALHGDSLNHKRLIKGVQIGEPEKDARHLIREVLSQNVTIHSNPDTLLNRPFDVPTFSLHPGTLQKYIKLWLEAYAAMPEDAPPWAVKYLHEHDKAEFEDAAQANQTRYSWQEVTEARSVYGAQLIVVHPALATYDAQLGFIAQRGNLPQREFDLPSQKDGDSAYSSSLRLETYAEHIRLVLEEFIKFWPSMASLAERLEQRYGWEKDSVRQAAELAVLLHDVGKLSQGWQGWVRTYQDRIGAPINFKEAYAHTDYDRDNPKHESAQKAVGKRPWHALEGAIAALPFIYARFQENPSIRKAIFTAIARHHAPFSSANQAFQLIPTAQDYICSVADTLEQQDRIPGLDKPISVYEGKKKYIPLIAQPDDPGAFNAYLLIVRLLRLADSEGTRRGAQKF